MTFLWANGPSCGPWREVLIIGRRCTGRPRVLSVVAYPAWKMGAHAEVPSNPSLQEDPGPRMGRGGSTQSGRPGAMRATRYGPLITASVTCFTGICMLVWAWLRCPGRQDLGQRRRREVKLVPAVAHVCFRRCRSYNAASFSAVPANRSQNAERCTGAASSCHQAVFPAKAAVRD